MITAGVFFAIVVGISFYRIKVKKWVDPEELETIKNMKSNITETFKDPTKPGATGMMLGHHQGHHHHN